LLETRSVSVYSLALVMVQDKAPYQLMIPLPWLRDVLAYICAGQGPYRYSTSCWTCQGSVCNIDSNTYALISPDSGNAPTNLTTVVTIPGRGTYRLEYWLMSGGSPDYWGSSNSWRAIIESVDRSFSPIVVETLTNIPFLDPTYRAMSFQIPTQTPAALIKFEVRQVRPFLPKNDGLSR
jgi:hypothetical protein